MTTIKNHVINVSGKTASRAKKVIRGYAQKIGMVADNIRMEKRGAMRSGGNPVWKATFDIRERKKRRR